MENKPFLGSDLHAKRNRPKSITLSAYTRKDPHGIFADTKKQYPSLAKLSKKKIADIFRVIGETFADQVVTNNRGIKLPGGLGGVVTGITRLSEKSRENNIDFKTSKDLGIIVHHHIWRTNGYIAKIYYTPKVYGGKFMKKYRCKFKPCRKLQRAVSAVMKTEMGYHNYFPSSKEYPITNIFLRKNKYPKTPWRITKAEKDKTELQRFLREEYDEFAFRRKTAR